MFWRKRYFIPVLAVLVVFPISIQSNFAFASPGVSLKVVSPSSNTPVNLTTSFALTFQLIGGDAAVLSHCNDAKFQNIQFAIAESDDKGMGRLLDWSWDGGIAHAPTFSQIKWSEKIIPNGLECSIIANSQMGAYNSRFSSEAFIPSYLNDWFGLQVPSADAVMSNAYTPTHLLIASEIGNGGKIISSYPISVDSAPTLSITNVKRGQTLDNYSVVIIEATMPASYVMEKGFEPTLYFGAATEGVSSSCATPKYDSKGLIIPQRKGTLNIYEFSCFFQNFGIAPGQSFDVSASGQYIGANDVVANTYSYGSPSFKSIDIGVVAGTPGRPQLSDKDNSANGKWPALVGKNPNQPWNVPASLHELGYLCTSPGDGSTDCSPQAANQPFDNLKVGNPIAGATIQLCVTRESAFGPDFLNPKCFTNLTGPDGKFIFSIPENSDYLQYSLAVSYKGFPLLVDREHGLGGGNAVALPRQPVTVAKTSLAGLTMNLPQSVKWGSPVSLQAAVKGHGMADCLVRFYYPDISRPGSFAPAGDSSAQRLTITGGRKKTLKVFLPINLKVRWYLVMSCNDSTTGANLKSATGFVTNY